METQRQHLVKKGLAKPGRGRFSAAAKAELERARREDGITFSDDNGPAKPVKVKSDKPVKEKKPASVSQSFGDTPAPLWEHANWYVIEADGTKKPLGPAEVCRTCGYSLSYQACKRPTYPSTITNEMLVVMR